jgi:3-oxoacyl-[acyl-carrier-protein] synthase II
MPLPGLNGSRVVVTGLGAVTPVGPDATSTWSSLVAGRSGIRPYQTFDPAACGLKSRYGGEAVDFDPEAHFERRTIRRMDRVQQLGQAAAAEALRDAGLVAAGDADPALNPAYAASERVGVYIGSGIGGVTTMVREEEVMRERGGSRVSPFMVPMMLADSVPGGVAIAHGLKGPNMAHLSACASGANSIGEAFLALRRGAADIMVAGGAEATMVPLVVAGFENMGALSTFQGEPAEASRPFDRLRDGFVMGEGAGVLVLERYEAAAARGAHMYAELLGYGSTADAVHITAPAEDGDGILRAVRAALADGPFTAGDVEYVSAHGTSTPLNDAVETRAMKALFGARAYEVPISSVKSMIGHLLGAGGAVEAVAVCRTVSEGVIPPTINLHNPDPACDLDYVPNVARRPDGGVRLALSTSLGFGGHNVALLFGRV